VRNAHGYAKSSRYAVGMSKRMVVREARQRGAAAVMIFEDDVTLHPQWREKLAGVTLPDDWGMFLLGCQQCTHPQSLAPGLVRVGRALDNHAIGIRAEWYERVLFALRHEREDAKQIQNAASDVTLGELMKEVPTYAVWPNVAGQAVYSYYGPDCGQLTNQDVLQNVEEVWRPLPRTISAKEDAWMGEAEREYMEEVLRTEMTMLEYGCGKSALHFSRMVKEYHAVEYEVEVFRKEAAAAKLRGVTLHYVPPNWPQQKPGEAALPGQFAQYANKGNTLDLKFGAVLLNGRARVECALAMLQKMPRGAWLFFPDYFMEERYFRRASELNQHFRMVKEFRHTQHSMAVFRRR
jgi:hypothetical protein